MPISTSLITFGTYVFPVGAQVRNRSIDQVVDEAQMLGRDGTITPGGYSGPLTVSVQIELGGGGDFSPFTGAELITLDDLNDECNRLYAMLANGYQPLIVGETPVRYLMAQKKKFSIEYLESSWRSHGTITLDFYAQDPRWLSGELKTLPLGDPPTSPPQPINAGMLRTYPAFTLIGPSTSPCGVVVTPAGATGTIGVSCAIALGQDQALLIDCDPRTPSGQRILLNGVPRMDLLGTLGLTNTIGNDALFPYLEPGTNHVDVNGAPAGGVLEWRDAWGL